MKSYFVFLMLDFEPVLIETTDLARILKRLVAYVESGFIVSNVSIKPTRKY